MKVLFLLVSFLSVFVPVSAGALNLGGSLAGEAAKNAGYSQNTTETTFAETLGTVVKGALSLVGVIFLILMVYAGFLWMTAHGKEEQIDKAQDIIRSSVIGLIITVGAYSITAFVLPKIVAKTTGPGGGSSAVGSAGDQCGPRGGHCVSAGGCGSPGTVIPLNPPQCGSGLVCCWAP